MKVIIPVAGEGTRLRPHTFTRPKPLLDCAGKTILDHVLKPLEAIEVDELIMVVGFLGEQIEKYVRNNYSYNVTFVKQEQLLGLGYALYLVIKDLDNSEILIILGDTIVDCNLDSFTSAGEYVLGLRQVDDPQRFGIAEIKYNRIIGLEEKPSDPKTNLALIGIYYFKESHLLKGILQKHIDSGKQTSGEIQFTDALQQMIKHGTEFAPYKIQGWYDCGTVETLLATNAYFLNRNEQLKTPNSDFTVAPVYISPSAQIINSNIGPNVSIGDNVVVENSNISNSIISEGAMVFGSNLKNSLIGRRAIVENIIDEINVGDDYKS